MRQSFVSKTIPSIVKSRWPYFVIVLAVFYVYYRTLFFGYTYLDDNTLILDSNWFLRNIAKAGRVFTKSIYL
jgi:hypothetical protein